MLKHLMELSLHGLGLAAERTREARFAGIRDACAAWRADRDIDAIMASFGRLTDRQLAMLGVHRDEIQYVVAELLATASERWRIGAEVAWMFDEAAESRVPATPGRNECEESAERSVI